MTRLMLGAAVGIALVCCSWLIGCGGAAGGGGGGGLVTPSAPQAVVVTTNSVTIAWSASGGDQTGFEIQRKTTGDFATIANVGGSTFQYSDAGLTQGFTYVYRVRATGAEGASDWSPELSVLVSAGGAATVSGRVVSLVGQTPISGATVTVGGVSGTTDGAGQFLISSVPTGAQTITISAPGFIASTPATVTINAGSNPLGDISLAPNSEGPPPPPPI